MPRKEGIRVVLVLTLLLAGAARAGGPSAPPAKVPPPRVLALSEIQAPDLKVTGGQLDFVTDLDLLAPLGNGEGNAAAYFKDFARQFGSREKDVEKARGRMTVRFRGRFYLSDEPLLLEAEPWADQATCRFYPGLLPMGGWETRYPDFLHMIHLARAWIDRGDQLTGEARMAEYRRAVRLGRLLRQDKVFELQEATGLSLIRMGSRAIYRAARAEGDAGAMVIAAHVLAECEAIHAAWARIGLTGEKVQFLQRLRKKKEPSFDGILDDQVKLLAGRTASPAMPRAARIANMETLWLVLHAGTPGQRKTAREALGALSGDGDEFVAAEASWYLEQPWDPNAPITQLVARIE
jgi:hypothetical protein